MDQRAYDCRHHCNASYPDNGWASIAKAEVSVINRLRKCEGALVSLKERCEDVEHEAHRARLSSLTTDGGYQRRVAPSDMLRNNTFIKSPISTPPSSESSWKDEEQRILYGKDEGDASSKRGIAQTRAPPTGLFERIRIEWRKCIVRPCCFVEEHNQRIKDEKQKEDKELENIREQQRDREKEHDALIEDLWGIRS
ncbi:uncharacterized protein PHALS_07198 [Plasmopara halstedii]|uniref:Uncharacterized protein n=1 Tax=Plasmopara halstedii TaxID=4781 RepID=A0A0P1B6R0_PLAHL|nr:uncharacterized protein PHALS_07198 [Plasmopara halstedii]CEG49434.1 hypothetical protein PHALS_07198 [Plasmopara halstedii]|eukprot:XP_024585803.1 hypothetical protein PHALS_07198 [Plasmopara halstedii]